LEFVRNLKTGWNLGNTLDAIPNVNNDGFQEIAWGNPRTKPEMIDRIKDAGCDLLRVPVTWWKQTGPAPDYRINPKFMERVTEVVDYGIDSGLTVILNTHHEEWDFPSDENYPANSERYKAIWKQIAENFADYDNRLILEGLNEPRKRGTDVEWNGGDNEGRRIVIKYNNDFVTTVRATGGNNATRMLMVTPYAASSDEQVLLDFILPDDPNLIVSVHAYTPYNFALNVSSNIKDFSPDDKADTRDIDALFRNLNYIFLEKGIPVILGETGALNKENTEARAEWAKYFAGKGREYGVPVCWWDNNAFTGDGENFGLLNRRELAWQYPEVLEAFVGEE
jgi:endoglucanase